MIGEERHKGGERVAADDMGGLGEWALGHTEDEDRRGAHGGDDEDGAGQIAEKPDDDEGEGGAEAGLEPAGGGSGFLMTMQKATRQPRFPRRDG
jgi:hypothetical protein